MGLTGKILLFIASLVVLLVGGTLAFTTIQADRLARSTIDAGLKETRDVWQHVPGRPLQQAAARRARAGNDPYFKAAIARARPEHGARHRSASAARTSPPTSDGDRPDRQADRAHRPPLGHRRRPLEGPDRQEARSTGEDSATLWLQGDQLFHAVSVPMQTGPELVGVLVAGYGSSEAVASQMHKLTHSEIAFLVRPAGQAAAARGLVARPARAGARAPRSRCRGSARRDAPFELDLGGRALHRRRRCR